MIRYLLNKTLLSMKKRYDYDVGYMQDILKTDLKTFLKFMAFQTMSAHSGNLPPVPLFAARLRAIIWDDCGPCTQLIVNMALEAGVDPDIIRGIINKELNDLPEEIALVARFTDLVLAHNPEADDLRDKILERWGKEGLITISYAISSTRVYPAIKYTLGYGKTCSRIQIDDNTLIPEQRSGLA